MEIYTWDYKRLNEDAKIYFKELLNKKDFKNYSTYLEKMFPSVKNYLKFNIILRLTLFVFRFDGYCEIK